LWVPYYVLIILKGCVRECVCVCGGGAGGGLLARETYTLEAKPEHALCLSSKAAALPLCKVAVLQRANTCTDTPSRSKRART
jgi:hypothetical protein